MKAKMEITNTHINQTTITQKVNIKMKFQQNSNRAKQVDIVREN